MEYESDTSTKFMAISRQVSPCFTTRCLLVTARVRVDVSGMIRTQMGRHNKSEMATMHGTPCAIPPRN
jgi:hypothetical protein